jgi:hypothetical protein
VREPPAEDPFVCAAADAALATEHHIHRESMWGINSAGDAVNAIDALRREQQSIPPPITLRHHECFEYDADDLESLPIVRLRSWHPSKRFADKQTEYRGFGESPVLIAIIVHLGNKFLLISV